MGETITTIVPPLEGIVAVLRIRAQIYIELIAGSSFVGVA
jgi:hypothetical protein